MFGYNLQCTVLEVKVVEGLGATLDVILVNGCLHAGDTMVLCTQDGPIVTTARALLTPPPSRETRVKSELIKHESLEGAIGLKITGDPELTKVAGHWNIGDASRRRRRGFEGPSSRYPYAIDARRLGVASMA